MTNATIVLLSVGLIGVPFASHLKAQWLNYPTAGVPKLPNGKPNLAAPTPRTADGKPDLSGIWDADNTGGTAESFTGRRLPPLFENIGARLKDGLPYSRWGRDLVNARLADNSKDSPDARCLPLGILWLHSHVSPRKMLQLPGLVVILYERFTQFRQIFTDGRPLPTDPEPSFFGYSTGKWEGDTLVVQTIGFRDDSWADLSGSPLTESAMVTERFRRTNYGNLEIEITVNDPKAYTVPWTVKLNQVIHLDTELLEFICVDNDKDRTHLVGK
jgi:hypothetical protein